MWALLVGSFAAASGFGTGPDASAPRWSRAGTWREPEGLPQDTVFTILQTRDGYMWMGTRGGLARFDGVRFTTFGYAPEARLPENEVWAIAEGDGSLWVGTYGGGLARLHEGRFDVLTTRDGLVNNYVRHLAYDAEGALWIGTDRGLSRLHGGRFTNYTVAQGLSHDGIRCLRADKEGRIWIGTKNGVFTVENGRLRPVPLGDGPEPVIDAVLRDRHGALWIGTSDGLFRQEGGKTRRYTTADGLSSNAVRVLFEDVQANLWIATLAGLDRHDGEARGVLPIVNEVPGLIDIRSLGEDREGSLWIGFDGHGLARFYQGLFTNYTQASGLADTDVRAVIEDRQGTMWVATAKGLSWVHAGRWTSQDATTGLPSTPVDALAQDADGYLWVGSAAGVHRSREKEPCGGPGCAPRFEPLPNPAVPQMHARAIYPDTRGNIWIGTNLEGLVRYRDGTFTTYTTQQGLSNDAVRALVEDGDGALWIGTKGGLDRFAGGTFTTYRQKNGLPSESVQALYRDRDQALWIATRSGLSRHKDGRFTSYTTEHGLYASHVYAFVEDRRGNLWMTCAKGVFRVPKRELVDFAEGRAPTVTSVPYGREHGLASMMSSVASSPGAIVTRDGRAWFSTKGGLAVIDPARLRSNTLVPPVHIEEVTVDGRTFPLEARAEAAAGRGEVVLRYTALSYLAPEKVRFRYILEGYDRAWVDAGARRVAYYTNLPPGDYRFRVVAANNDGVWNEKGALVQLRLAPHFHQTTWFYALVALALGLAGAATQYLRLQRSKARERELAARVDAAVAQVKVLSGLLPICASCKKIRDDKGYWNQMEAYIHEHSQAEFSHGICPECMEKLYPEFAEKNRRAAGVNP